MYDTIGMRSPVINKIAFVGILAALLIAVPMSMTMFDEQALFADLNDIFSLAALAGGFLAIVIGSARMCGRCGGDLPMEKSAGCIIAMAGLVFFYPYLADFWGMPYSMTVMMFGIAFLLFFAAIADALAAYTNRLPELKRFFIAVAVVMFVLTALCLIRMEYDFIDFSGDLGWYVDLFVIIVAAVYIACSSYAAGYGYEVDAPRGSGLGKTAEAFSGPSGESYVRKIERKREVEWAANEAYAAEIQKELAAEQDARAAATQAARDKALKAAAEKAAAKEAEEKAAKEAAEAADKATKDAANDDIATQLKEALAAKEAAEQEAQKAKDDLKAAIAEAEEILLAEHAAKEAAEQDAQKAKDDLNAAIAEAEEILLAEHAAKEAAEAEAAEAKNNLQLAIAEAEEILLAEHAAREAAEKEAAEAKAEAAKAREEAEKAKAEAKVAKEAAEKAKVDAKVVAAAAVVDAAGDDEADADDAEAIGGFEDDSADYEASEGVVDIEPLEDIWTDKSPEALVRRAAWNKGLRCRRNYGPYSIPVAFVKGKVAVFVTHPDSDTSIDAQLESEGWVVIRYNEDEITDGLAQGDEVAKAVKAHIREMKALKKKKKKKPVKN